MVWGMSSCSDWLDVMPGTSIPEKKLYAEEFGFKDVLTGFYLKMGENALYGKELTWHYLDMLGGRYDCARDMYNWKNIYNYEQKEYKELKNAVYAEMYNIIANINNFLYYTDANREVIKTPHYYEIMKGEALGLRAYLHFDLLRLFGPVYAEAPEAEAVPWRKELNNLPTPLLPAREIVENCLADLKTADSLLTGNDPECFLNERKQDAFLRLRQFRMNTYAVKALMARIYCYKGDAESKRKAAEYAKAVIESGHFTLRSNTGCPNFFREHIFSLYIYELRKTVDPLLYNVSFPHILGITKEKFEELYETKILGSSDMRTNIYGFAMETEANAKKMVSRKFDQSLYAAGYDEGNAYKGAESIPLIRLSEMYYILAECTEKPLESADYIDVVRFARSIPYSDALARKADIVNGYDELDTRPGHDREHTIRQNELMKEYQKEFYGEGQLFYFYKRLNYKTFFLCPLEDVREKYKISLPEDEAIFGDNSKQNEK